MSIADNHVRIIDMKYGRIALTALLIVNSKLAHAVHHSIQKSVLTSMRVNNC